MIDLRSDTLTKPDREMLESILTASFGDAGRLDEAINILNRLASVTRCDQ